MRRFTDQFVAVFVAVLINAALFWVLANGVQHSLTATDTDERAVMQVVWLTRPSVGQAPPRVMVAKRSATSAPENRRRQQAQRPTVESPQTTTSTSVLDVVGDDQWTPNALGGNIGNTNALSTQSALYPAVEQGGLGLSGAGVEDFGRGSAVLNGGARGDLPPISAVGSSAALRAVAASCRDRVLLAWRAFAATTAPRARVGRVVPEDSGPGAAHPSCRSGRGWPEWPPAPRRWPRCVPSRHSARMSPRRCRTPA